MKIGDNQMPARARPDPTNVHLASAANSNTTVVAAYTVVGDSFKADKPQRRTGVRPEVHDKVVFVSNFFDYLKKIAPVKR